MDVINIKKEDRLKKVNLKDKNILVFEETIKSNYFKPINTNALNYLKKFYKKYRENEAHDIEYTVVDIDERTERKYQLNLLRKFLDEIKVKDKGLVKINEDMLVYTIIDKKLTPLNTKSEVNKDNLKNLVTVSPIYIEDVWIDINKKFAKYLEGM